MLISYKALAGKDVTGSGSRNHRQNVRPSEIRQCPDTARPQLLQLTDVLITVFPVKASGKDRIDLCNLRYDHEFFQLLPQVVHRR